MSNGEVRVEDLVGERLIMTYLERRLATVPDDRLGDALSSVAAQEPAVSDLIKKTWVLSFVHCLHPLKALSAAFEADLAPCMIANKSKQRKQRRVANSKKYDLPL